MWSSVLTNECKRSFIIWKRAETKRQHSSSVVSRIKHSQTESNETERD